MVMGTVRITFEGDDDAAVLDREVPGDEALLALPPVHVGRVGADDDDPAAMKRGQPGHVVGIGGDDDLLAVLIVFEQIDRRL